MPRSRSVRSTIPHYCVVAQYPLRLASSWRSTNVSSAIGACRVDFPHLGDAPWVLAVDQRIGANHARSSVRQAGTGRQLKPVHRINIAWRILSCVDRNDHPILVEDIELRLNANAGEYAPHGSWLDRRWLDRRRSPPHVNAHQFLTDAAHPVRMLVIAEAGRLLLL